MAWWKRNEHRQAKGSSNEVEEHRAPSSFDAYVARNEAGERYALLQMVFSGAVSLALLWVATVTDNQAAGLALAIPLIFFAYAFERWQDARGGRESLRRDVIALSNVLYQDAITINRVLEDEMIHEYLQNLLQAALDDEEFGRAYWQQAVHPFSSTAKRDFAKTGATASIWPR